MLSLSWTERHRPSRLVDVHGNEEIIKALQSYKSMSELPNTILHGPPGSGKTSSILAMAKGFFGESNMATRVLELNAGDVRGVQTIRHQILCFTRCSSVTERATNGIKLIILDEADGLTDRAQCALRHLIESSKGARFCLCCNYVSKLSIGLRSRCTQFRFSGVGKVHLGRTVQTVADKEGLKVSRDAISAVVDVCAGDARQAINLLQSLSLSDVNLQDTREHVHAVYISCGLPSPVEICAIFDALLTQSFSVGHDVLSCVTEKQFSLVQILRPLVGKIISCAGELLESERVGGMLSVLADVERSLSEGGSEQLAVGATVSAFHLA